MHISTKLGFRIVIKFHLNCVEFWEIFRTHSAQNIYTYFVAFLWSNLRPFRAAPLSKIHLKLKWLHVFGTLDTNWKANNFPWSYSKTIISRQNYIETVSSKMLLLFYEFLSAVLPTALCGTLQPRHGASLGCEWRERPPDREDSRRRPTMGSK